MKNYFLIVDTETTQDQMVADFGAVIVDKKGVVYSQCAVLVDGIFTDHENHPLFFTSDSNDKLWGRPTLDRRYKMYSQMVAGGSRMVASIGAINRWLDRALTTYNPMLTAYNLPFDLDKCRNTGIDLTGFASRSFCLWSAAYTVFAHSKEYRNFALDLHAFNAPTAHGNMTFKTNAETMARFVLNNPGLEDEPHTALEDALFYELPILQAVLSRKPAKWLLEGPRSYNWRDCQVKDYFSAK